MNNLLIFLLLLTATTLSAIGAAMFKYSAKEKKLIIKQLEKSKLLKKTFLLKKYVFLGMILYVIASFIFVFLLKYVPLNILYPAAALNYVFSSIIGFKYFKEKITRNKITIATTVACEPVHPAASFETANANDLG